MNIESGIITSDNHVLSGSVTGELFCWDLVGGNVVKKYTHTSKKVLNSISIHPTQDIVLTASVQTIKVWGKAENAPENVVNV